MTEQKIKAFYNVYNTLGYGFLERVCQNAMYIELSEMGLKVDAEKKVYVCFKEKIVGDYNSDLSVEDVVICELKTQECLHEDDDKQLINYLRATNIGVGLLLNFGKEPEIKRKIFDNDKKAWHTTRITKI